MIELLLVIYLTSGTIKSFIDFLKIHVSVDITLLTSVILLFLIFKNRHKLSTEPSQYYPLFMILQFYCWMMFSLFYTSSKIYSYDKTFLFATNIVPIIVMNIIDRFDVRSFLKYFVICSLVYYVAYLPILLADLKFFSIANISVFEVDEYAGSLYLTIGEMLGASILILSTHKELFESSKKRLFILLVSVIGLLQMGARGPIVFVVVVLLTRVIWNKVKENSIFRINKSNIKYVVMLILAFLTLYLMVPSFKTTISRTIARFSVVGSGLSGSRSYGASIDARIIMYGDSKRILQKLGWQSIIGSGIGSYGVEAYGLDFRAYPHNVFLEIFVEMGAIGFIIFMIFLAATLIPGERNKSNMQYILFYMFLNIMKSSSLVDIRLLFMFLMIHWYEKRQKLVV